MYKEAQSSNDLDHYRFNLVVILVNILKFTQTLIQHQSYTMLFLPVAKGSLSHNGFVCIFVYFSNLPFYASMYVLIHCLLS